MITRRIILQIGFSQSATAINMDGYLNTAAAPPRTTQEMQQKPDDEFIRTISHINNGNEYLADFGSGPWILGRH